MSNNAGITWCELKLAMGIDHTPWDFGITGKKKKSHVFLETVLGLGSFMQIVEIPNAYKRFILRAISKL